MFAICLLFFLHFNSRVVPDTDLAGYPANNIAGYRMDIQLDKILDIRPDNRLNGKYIIFSLKKTDIRLSGQPDIKKGKKAGYPEHHYLTESLFGQHE